VVTGFYVSRGKRDPVLSGADPGRLSAVAAAAAIRAGVPAEIEVEAVDGVVMLPSLGSATVDGPAAVVRITRLSTEILSAGGRVTLPPDPHRDAPGWLGLHRVRAGILNVIVDDLDAFRMPSSADLAPRLSPGPMMASVTTRHGGMTRDRSAACSRGPMRSSA